MLAYTLWGIAITLVSLALAFVIRYTPHYAIDRPEGLNNEQHRFAVKMYLMMDGDRGCRFTSNTLFILTSAFALLYALSWGSEPAKVIGGFLLFVLGILILALINMFTKPFNAI